MSYPALFAVVSIQVLVFQFLSLRLTRSLPDYLVGYEGLPRQSAKEVAQFKQQSGRVRQMIGILLWAAAILFGLMPYVDPARSKLALAAVSLISSAVFVVGFLHDHRAVRRISAGLPDPAVRTASLQQRSLSRHYPVVWEALPVALVAATVALTLWAASSPSAAGRWQLFVIPVIQTLFVFGGVLWSMYAARSGRALPQRARPFVGGGESAAVAGETLRSLELQFSLAARIGVTLMFGLMQAAKAVTATGRHAPGWLGWSHWVVVVLLLALFAACGLMLSGVRKKRGNTEAR